MIRRNVAIDANLPERPHPRVELELVRTQSKALLAMPDFKEWCASRGVQWRKSPYWHWLRELIGLDSKSLDEAERFRRERGMRLVHRRLCERQGWGEAR